MRINVKLDETAFMPMKAHEEDAGFDIRTPIDFFIKPRKSMSVDTGVHLEIPKGYVGMLKSKSGLNVKHDILSEGVVDAGYSGSIVAKLYNHSDTTMYFNRGDKITQIVIMPIPDVTMNLVDEISSGERGENGFGSTGK